MNKGFNFRLCDGRLQSGEPHQQRLPPEGVVALRLIASPSCVRVSLEKFDEFIDNASATQPWARDWEQVCPFSGRAFLLNVSSDASPYFQSRDAGVAQSVAIPVRLSCAPGWLPALSA